MNLRQNQCCYSTPSSAITSLHLCFVPLFKSSLFYLFFIVHFALYYFSSLSSLFFLVCVYFRIMLFRFLFFLRFLSTYGRRFLYYGFHINNKQLYSPPLFFSFFSVIPFLLFFTFSPLIRLFLLSPSLPYHLNHIYKTKKKRKKEKKKKKKLLQVK